MWGVGIIIHYVETARTRLCLDCDILHVLLPTCYLKAQVLVATFILFRIML